jgi:ribosomal protein S18 acetylase RimI-like enzyme
MITNAAIEGNLYDVYGEIIASGLVISGKTRDFNFVAHPGYAWPNMIYPGRQLSMPSAEIDIQSLDELRSLESCPRLVIFGETYMTADTPGQLAQLRFRPATRWINMAIGLDQPEIKTPQGQLRCQVIDVDRREEWRDWSSVVGSVLFKEAKLDHSIFKYAVEKGIFQLLIGYYDNQPVTTSLLYLGKCAGVYMVATLPAFQGKGFARELMQFAQSKAGSARYDSMILHSTQAGVDFYNRIGFREYGKLLLFYSML